MDFKEYQAHFSKIVDGDDVAAPYDEPEYMDYTKLNWSRTNRWLKRGELDSDLKSLIESIDDAQEWLVITEPWCGDAAHSVPFIHMLADLNPKISLRVELRDQPPHSIDKYLTNGTKSIPKLVVRDASGKDLFTWGPRPDRLQVIFDEKREEEADFEDIKEMMQKWYNEDKGHALQEELKSLMKEHIKSEG